MIPVSLLMWNFEGKKLQLVFLHTVSDFIVTHFMTLGLETDVLTNRWFWENFNDWLTNDSRSLLSEYVSNIKFHQAGEGS